MLARGHRGDFSDAQTVHIPIGGAEDRETEGAPGNRTGAFVSGAYAVVLVLATTIPFVLAIAVLAIAALWARRAFSRNATTASHQA